jgi:hypothetical protein
MLHFSVPSTCRDIGITLLAGATVLAAAIAVVPSRANAADLVVRYDQSTLLKLPRSVADVIIGNPSIADVAVQGGNMLVITGKSFGVTNIIALDSERNVIQDQRLIVIRDEARILNLHKGGSRLSYNCSPNCNLTLTIGDDFSHFDNLGKSTDKKLKMGDSSAENAGQSSQ